MCVGLNFNPQNPKPKARGAKAQRSRI